MLFRRLHNQSHNSSVNQRAGHAIVFHGQHTDNTIQHLLLIAVSHIRPIFNTEHCNYRTLRHQAHSVQIDIPILLGYLVLFHRPQKSPCNSWFQSIQHIFFPIHLPVLRLQFVHAAAQCLDQFFPFQGFDQIIIHVQFNGIHSIFEITVSRVDNDFDWIFLLPQLADRLYAANPRHINIHYGHIRFLVFQKTQHFNAVG